MIEFEPGPFGVRSIHSTSCVTQLPIAYLFKLPTIKVKLSSRPFVDYLTFHHNDFFD